MAITAQKVLNMISKYALTATFYDTADSDTYEPETGVRTQTETEYTEYISPPANTVDYVAGTVIPEGVTVTYLSSQGLSFTPRLNMKLLIGVDKWVINRVTEYNGQAGATIAYKLEISK